MRGLLPVIACLLVSVPAFAQDQDPFTATQHADASAGGMTRASGIEASSIVNTASLFSLDASKADKKVTGQVGFQLGDFILTVGASADVNSDDSSTGPTTLATLDGLANKTTGTLSFLWSHWNVSGGNPLAILKPACQKYADKTGKKLSETDCSPEGLAKDNSDEGQKAQKAIMGAVDAGTIYFLGADAKVAPEAFTYVSDPGDPTSVAKETTEHHTSWSAGVAGGVVLPWNMTVAAIISREVAYNAGKSGQICSPVGTQGLTSCQNHVLTAPGDPDRSNLISVEVKQFFGASFALAPRFEFDVTKNAQAIALPIYVLTNSNGGLNGGVTIGWRSDTKAVTASAFVGDVLTLLTKSGN